MTEYRLKQPYVDYKRVEAYGYIVEYWYDMNGNILHLKYMENGFERWSEYDFKGNEIFTYDNEGNKCWSEYSNFNKCVHNRYLDNDGFSESYYDMNENTITKEEFDEMWEEI
jgi:hypothetical protein